MLDLTGHYCVSNLLAFEKANEPAKLTNTHPFNASYLLFDLGLGLFLYRSYNDLRAAFPRALDHEEWEPPIACN
jgi:hypothetical protein